MKSERDIRDAIQFSIASGRVLAESYCFSLLSCPDNPDVDSLIKFAVHSGRVAALREVLE